ncbi:MAG TPA: VanZ family protein [Gammaproteobacteria bacterium]
MLELRYPWVWLALGWALVVTVCVGSLVPGKVLQGVSISDKLMHAGSYCVLMVWFAGLYRRKVHWLIALTLFLLGLGLDLLQGRTATRSFDLLDVGANAGGVLFGLALSLWLLEGWCQRVERRLLA